jgi:hypothetical protein
MKKQTSLTLLLAASAVISTPNVQAAVRLNVPEDNEPVFYARINGGEFTGGQQEIYHTEEWAAIVFYRQPDCVPGGFNLLTFFDFSIWALPPADRCPLTIEGLEVWDTFPPVGPAGPIQAKFRGLGAVPVWFVSWAELQALIADGVLTIGELESAPTLLKGHADRYNETLHPPELSLRQISIDAQGRLEDSTQFQFQAAVSFSGSGVSECCSSDGQSQHVLIRFR